MVFMFFADSLHNESLNFIGQRSARTIADKAILNYRFVKRIFLKDNPFIVFIKIVGVTKAINYSSAKRRIRQQDN